MIRATILAAAVSVAAACTDESITPIDLLHRADAACKKALPQSERPTPTWRSCGYDDLCFYCADDAGRLVPVHLPCTDTRKVHFDDGMTGLRRKMCDRDQ